MKDKDIHVVMRLLEAEMRQFGLPPVSAMAEEAIVDPFKILVSTILSARTKDEVTGPATERLFALADSPGKMSRLSEERIEKAIFPAGFYHTKAKAIRKTSQELVERFRLPRARHDRGAADASRRRSKNGKPCRHAGPQQGGCLRGHPRPPHHEPLGLREDEDSPRDGAALRAKLPKKHWIAINTILVMHGQNICKPLSPLCSRCPVFKCCARIGRNEKPLT